MMMSAAETRRGHKTKKWCHTIDRSIYESTSRAVHTFSVTHTVSKAVTLNSEMRECN